MEFLGYSQTFIGVLTSLVVLCILDSGNFIHGILGKIGDRIDEEIKSLDKSLDLKSKIEGQSNYKLFQLFIRTSENKKLKMSALELDMTLNASFNKYKSYFTPQFIKPASSLVDKIKNSKEQLIAPLYVLLYCVVIFVCDEMVCAKLVAEDFIVTFLTIFTSFSFVFWGILWYVFVRNIKIVPEDGKEEKTKSCFEKWICKHATWGKTILLLLICSLVSLCPSLMQLDKSLNLFCFLFGLILYLLVIAIITFCRVRSHELFGHYLYVFSLKHFIGIFSLSLFLSGVLFVYSSCCNEIEDFYFTYTSFVNIKFFIIAFIIINGLSLPFLMPYKGFNSILNIVQREAHNEELKFEKKIEEINKTLEDFCKKINVSVPK